MDQSAYLGGQSGALARPLPPEDRLVHTLQAASDSIDRLWRSSLEHGPTDVAIRLGDASLAVHRALLALEP